MNSNLPQEDMNPNDIRLLIVTCFSHFLSHFNMLVFPAMALPLTKELVRLAEHSGCGARFAGAGAGGSLWAIGKEKDIHQLRKLWESALAPVRSAKVLRCEVDPLGVR